VEALLTSIPTAATASTAQVAAAADALADAGSGGKASATAGSAAAAVVEQAAKKPEVLADVLAESARKNQRNTAFVLARSAKEARARHRGRLGSRTGVFYTRACVVRRWLLVVRWDLCARCELAPPDSSMVSPHHIRQAVAAAPHPHPPPPQPTTTTPGARVCQGALALARPPQGVDVLNPRRLPRRRRRG
jgi:hypothetical protein